MRSRALAAPIGAGARPRSPLRGSLRPQTPAIAPGSLTFVATEALWGLLLICWLLRSRPGYGFSFRVYPDPLAVWSAASSGAGHVILGMVKNGRTALRWFHFLRALRRN